MKITVSEEIRAPQAHVFKEISDFPTFEHHARQRGAKIVRADTSGSYGAGSVWQVRFSYRGKKRDVELTLQEFTAPDLMRLVSVASAVEGEVLISLHPLGSDRTRIDIDASITPKTLAARLLLQSLKLAKGRIKRKIRRRVYGYVRDIEDSFGQT